MARRKGARDFSRQSGQRLRITMGVYDPRTRTFKAVGRAAALITVADANQRKDLWRLIEETVSRFAEDTADGTRSPGHPLPTAAPAV
jgi:hypothetical protein